MSLKDKITLVLAIIGAAGTIYTLVSTVLFQRRNIRITIRSMSQKQNNCALFVTIENLSRLSISITAVSICLDDRLYPCRIDSVKYSERTMSYKNQVVERIPYYSTALPITLSSLAATSANLRFERIPENQVASAKDLTLQVSTNRGSAIRMTLGIPRQDNMSHIPR